MPQTLPRKAAIYGFDLSDPKHFAWTRSNSRGRQTHCGTADFSLPDPFPAWKSLYWQLATDQGNRLPLAFGLHMPFFDPPQTYEVWNELFKAFYNTPSYFDPSLWIQKKNGIFLWLSVTRPNTPPRSSPETAAACAQSFFNLATSPDPQALEKARVYRQADKKVLSPAGEALALSLLRAGSDDDNWITATYREYQWQLRVYEA